MKSESIIAKSKRLLSDPDFYIRVLLPTGIFNKMSDEKFLKMRYRALMGKPLDLDHPVTYNEKLQWLKIHDREPIYTKMVDKYLAKDYISEKVGNQYIVPTIGIFDSFSEIDFEKLPEQFVMKCTHDSGGLIVCQDKKELDVLKAKKKINKCLRKEFFYVGREWPYKDVKPRILIEEYLEDAKTEELRDYKFFMFNGVPKVFYITSGRFKGDKATDFFDMDLNHLDIQDDDPNAETQPDFPKNFNLMVDLAKKLSVNIPHLRVDFYEVNGKVYVGELTFYYSSGFVPFNPEKWDKIFGSWIVLPEI